jgi:hypothetical protein
MKVRTNYQRGLKVIGTIMDLYFANEEPFNRPNAVLPQDPAHMPHNLLSGSVGHANFLFHVCYYMRGGVASDTAVKMLSQVYERHPEYFVPAFAATQLSSEELAAELQRVGLNYNKSTIPAIWIDNAERLQRLWGGDTRNILDGVSDWDEACLRIQNRNGNGFRGFQKKMVSMLTYFLMDAEFVDPFNFPIPVDFHVARITLGTEIVKVYRESPTTNLVQGDEVLDVIRDFYLRYAIEQHVDPRDLCNAVWLYSRHKCVHNPGNETFIEGKRKARDTIVKKKLVDWQSPQALNEWLISCGTCLLRPYSKWNIASGFYYAQGRIALSDPREDPPRNINALMPLQQMLGAKLIFPGTGPKQEAHPDQLNLELTVPDPN